jgi:hypothetical protein
VGEDTTGKMPVPPRAAAGSILDLTRGGESSGGSVRALFNLGERTARLPGGLDGGASVLLRSEAEAYGGRREAGPPDELAPFEFIILGPPSWRAFPDR